MSEQLSQDNMTDSHPEPETKLKISIFEPIIGIIIAIAATVIFLLFSQIIAVVIIDGPVIETFLKAEIQRLAVLIPAILWALFRIGVEATYLVERRYTKRLAKISVIGNALAVICAIIALVSPRIVNPDYITVIRNGYENVSAAWFGNILANPHLIILFVIIIVLVLDSVNVLRRGYKKVKEDEEGSDEDKQQADDSHHEPESKIKNVRFSYFEPVKGIIFTIVVTVLFLVFPQIIAFVFYGSMNPRLIPTFDAVVIRYLIILIPAILWALLRIGIEIAYMIERSYTKRLALITVIGNFLAIICGVFIFISPQIVYGEYIAFVHRYFEDMAAWFSVPLTRILDRPNLIVLVIMLVALVIESINVVRKAHKENADEDDDGEVEPKEAKSEEPKPEDTGTV